MRIVLAVLSVLLLCAITVSAAKDVSDDIISDQVRTRLTGDRDVGGGHIDVKVSNGVVQLDGIVKKDSIKSKAERIAKKVKGVQKVVNNLRVSPTGT